MITLHLTQPQGGSKLLFAAAAPKYLVIVFVVSDSVFVFKLLALAFDFFLRGFLSSLLVVETSRRSAMRSWKI